MSRLNLQFDCGMYNLEASSSATAFYFDREPIGNYVLTLQKVEVIRLGLLALADDENRLL